MAPTLVPIIAPVAAPQPRVKQVPAWWFVDSTPLLTASVAYTDGADVFVGNAGPLATATLSYTDGADSFSGVVDPLVGTALVYTDGADIFAGAINIYDILIAMNVTDGADIWAAASGWSVIDNPQSPNWVIIPNL